MCLYIIAIWHYINFFPPPLMLTETCDLLREWLHGKPDTLTPADKLVISIWGRSSVTCSRVKLIWGRFPTDDASLCRSLCAEVDIGLYNSRRHQKPTWVSVSYLIFAFICIDSHLWSLVSISWWPHLNNKRIPYKSETGFIMSSIS